MKQIKEDMICYYCIGCNKEEIENFEGVRNCKNFMADRENWREELYKNMRGEQKKNANK